MSGHLLDYGLRAHAARLCVLPPREDGSKQPLSESWEHYQHGRSTEEEIRAWYGPRSGIGYVCGAVSGNLELFEFDDLETYQEFKSAAIKVGLGDLVEWIEAGYCSETPGGGIHWLTRCPEIAGNTKLAQRSKRTEEKKHPKDNVKTLIETRGEGGYTVEAPSNGRVHKTGRPYVLVSGSVETIATITPEERADLHELARSFDQMPKQASRPRQQPAAAPSGDDVKPGEDFNARASWAEILEPAGWAYVFSRGEVDHWRRPGKNRGTSATTNWGDSDLFYPFSTSTEFEAEKGYSKWRVYAILHHGGDFQAAARELAQRGYGTDRELVGVGIRAARPVAALRDSPASVNGAGQVDRDQVPPAAPPADPEPEATRPRSFALTDLGNSERLVHHFGQDIRYYPAASKWLYWDGRRWREDTVGRIYRLAKQTVRLIYTEAAEAETDAERKELAKHAIKSEGKERIKAMVELAQSELPVEPADLDADPWLLNVANGTLDLRTGLIREHRREDLITKLAPVAYDPEADCPTWRQFLATIMADQDGKPKRRLIAFLRRMLGYAMTADTTEQVIFLLWGNGSNGKSTFLETGRAVLGDYAQQADFSTFLYRDYDRVSNDIARMMGTRFVSAVEVEGTRRLAETLVKQLTGGDTVTARFLFREFFEFKPAFKVLLAANHRPAIHGTDWAIWRRIRLIPFTITILEGKQDKKLAEKLRRELPGILNWMLRGCLTWHRKGLGVPDEVREATKEYREESDIIGPFLDESCELNPTATVSASELYQAYTKWCERNGDQAVKQTTFGLRLTERGVQRAKGSGGRRVYVGLRLVARSGEVARSGASPGQIPMESPREGEMPENAPQHAIAPLTAPPAAAPAEDDHHCEGCGEPTRNEQLARCASCRLGRGEVVNPRTGRMVQPPGGTSGLFAEDLPAAPPAPRQPCTRSGCPEPVPPDRKLYCSAECEQADAENLRF